MTTMVRRASLGLAGAVGAAMALLGTGVTPALADGPPELTAVDPRVVVTNGQPLHVTVVGSNLSGLISVTLVPAMTGITFTQTSPGTLALTLPASTPPETYSVLVTTTGGTSDPGTAPSFEVAAPVAPIPAAPAGAPPVPKYSFAPYPGGQTQTEPQTGVVEPGVSVTHPNPLGPSSPLNPFVLLPLGIVAGGIGYLLWGRPGRLAAAERQGLVAHLIGRPLQALRIGRICLQCGRLHLILGTRRDLWQAGQFCSASCFVAAQEDDSAARAGESTAVTRMREMFVYSELEENLKMALAGDVHALEHAAAIGDPGIEAVLAPPA